MDSPGSLVPFYPFLILASQSRNRTAAKLGRERAFSLCSGPCPGGRRFPHRSRSAGRSQVRFGFLPNLHSSVCYSLLHARASIESTPGCIQRGSRGCGRLAPGIPRVQSGCKPFLAIRHRTSAHCCSHGASYCSRRMVCYYLCCCCGL